MRYAMIMAGGAGTRLWPSSRRARPKQLLPLIDGRSLLEIAIDRLDGLVPPDRLLICTGEDFRDIIDQTLPDFVKSGGTILAEPAGRDTANAVAFTAAVLHKQDHDARFAVLTADHLITPQQEFLDRAETAFELVEDDPRRLVTFAITPTFAATGYGWVQRGQPIPRFEGAFNARQFIEKPNEQLAQKCLLAHRETPGSFGWNSGMFVYNAATILDCTRRFLPDNAIGIDRIADAWDTADADSTLQQVYPTLPRISVDHGIMEPASNADDLTVCVVPMDVQWLDVGSWPSYAETLTRHADEHGNVAPTNTRALHLDSKNILAVSDDPAHTITTIGCEDLIVVHTRDATLICPRDKAQQVKDLAARVDETLR